MERGMDGWRDLPKLDRKAVLIAGKGFGSNHLVDCVKFLYNLGRMQGRRKR
jgi:hypothetical protein